MSLKLEYNCLFPLNENNELAICELDSNGVVIAQNNECVKICGELDGSKCKGICIEQFVNTSPALQQRSGFHPLPRRKISGRIFDGLILKTKKGFYTLLFPLDEKKWDPVNMDMPNLTATEQKIMKYRVEQGLSNSEICKELGIASATLKTHVSRINKKLKSAQN